MTEQKQRGLGRPISVVRAELMADEETRTIAENLGMPLEAYVERVLHYAQNPDAEPQLEIVDDEVLQEMDPQLPTMNDMMAWVKQVDEGEIPLGPQEFSTDFDDEESTMTRQARTVAGDTSAVAAPVSGEGKGQIRAGDDEAGRLLKQQLLRETQAVRTRAADRTPRRKKKPADPTP